MTELTQLAEDQKLQTLKKSATVFEAATMMSINKVGSILIMEGNDLIGIFTERDLVNRVVAKGKNYNDTIIKDVMSTHISTVSETTSLTECYEIMKNKKCRHLPLVSADNKILGVVSMRDLLDWRVKDMEFENKELKHYIMS